jgi:RNA polymerase sigma factor for flagellar operon FliA
MRSLLRGSESVTALVWDALRELYDRLYTRAPSHVTPGSRACRAGSNLHWLAVCEGPTYAKGARRRGIPQLPLRRSAASGSSCRSQAGLASGAYIMSAFVELFESGLVLVPIVVRCVKRRFGARADIDDVTSFAQEGLMVAAQTFEATRGIPFRRWAKIKMHFAVLEGVRSQSVVPRRLNQQLRDRACVMRLEGTSGKRVSRLPATAEAADALFGDHLATMATAIAMGNLMDGSPATIEALIDTHATPEEALAREELKDAIGRAIAALPAAERALLRRYYFEGMTLDRAAGGLSRSWACRIHARAIAKVSRSLTRTVVKTGYSRSADGRLFRETTEGA